VHHPNARLTARGRRELCRRVLEEGLSRRQAAEELGVSRQTASKWLLRYLAEGETGLLDRSSRPHRLPHRVPVKLVRRIVRTRQRERIGAHRISWKLKMCRSTVCVVLRRVGLSRIRDLDPKREPPLRYEWPEAGDLLHLDTKRLGRIGPGGGKRVHGWRHGRGNEHRGIGWEFVHVAIDDHSRLAYAEVLPNERADTTCAFLQRALVFYDDHGIEVRRILTDNAPCYYAHVFRRMLEQREIRELKTAIYHPQTNGKAEAMVKVLCNNWAYTKPYNDTAERIEALGRFLHRYNHLRPHGGLNGATPISRTPGNNHYVRYN
jgi:transposase InsO family protein